MVTVVSPASAPYGRIGAATERTAVFDCHIGGTGAPDRNVAEQAQRAVIRDGDPYG